MKAVVVGAGVGGLTTAIALERAGLDVEVFERRPGADAIEAGTGLTIWANAVTALRRLGLADVVEAVGTPTEWFEQVTVGGRTIARWPVGELSRQTGAQTVGITRSELMQVLRGALRRSPVHMGTGCVGFAQDDDGVTVELADGGSARADLLIGADGIRSGTRERLFGPSPPRYAGYAAWRGLADIDDDVAPPGVFRLLWGRGARFGFYRVTAGRLYWFAVANAPERQGDSERGRKQDVLDRFAGWPGGVEEMVGKTDDGVIQRTDIYDRDPLPQWTEGRVAVAGDAAHAMTFNVGQGACQAIEDGVVLGELLVRRGEVVPALQAYEAARKARTSAMIRRARLIGQAGMWANPAVCFARDRLLGVLLSRVGVQKLRRELLFPSAV